MKTGDEPRHHQPPAMTTASFAICCCCPYEMEAGAPDLEVTILEVAATREAAEARAEALNNEAAGRWFHYTLTAAEAATI